MKPAIIALGSIPSFEDRTECAGEVAAVAVLSIRLTEVCRKSSALLTKHDALFHQN